MKLSGALLLAASMASCPTPPAPPVPPAPATLAFDLVACHTDPVDDYCDGPAGAVFQLHLQNDPPKYLTVNGDGNGYVFVSGFPSIPDSDLTITVEGYNALVVGIKPATLVATNKAGHHNFFRLTATHADPSTLTLEQVSAIRGAMWSARLNLPYGPRPGQDSNILALGFYDVYGAGDRTRMLEAYRGRGYTHAVTGPIQGNDCYHGLYPCYQGAINQGVWDRLLDELQEWADRGILGVYFAHEDGDTFEQTRDKLTPYLSQARSQRLIRVFVPAGWEPTRYGWSSCTWAAFAQWGRAVLPNALILLHTVADVDAPAGSDERCNDDDHTWNPDGNGGAWSRVAPFVHGWLIQNGPYPGAPGDDAELARNFAAQFMADGEGAAQHSPAWHFAHGINGWPTGSAWGDGRPVRLYNAENTSYNAFWHNLAESASMAWGDLAISSGAAGYLDSGSVPVP